MISDESAGRLCAAAFAVLATLGATGHASAAGPGKEKGDLRVGATVEDQKAVMDAQIELLKKQAELRQAQRALAGTSSLGLPTVLSVTTFGDRRVARLMTASGQVSHFSEGDQVQPGVVIASVRAREVVVAIENGKRITTMPLQFSLAKTGPNDGRGGASGQGADLPPGLLPEPPSVPLPVGMPLPMRLPELPPQPKPATTAPATPQVPLGVPAPGPIALPGAAALPQPAGR